MNRKEFILNTAKMGLGAFFLPGLLSSCQDENLFEEINFQGKVVIIGAGVAGLYAGYLLRNYGIDFLILEASDRAGGRMGRESSFASFPIDTGAQWLHGDFSILGDLVKSSGTQIFVDNSETLYWYKGQLVSELPTDLTEMLESLTESTTDVSYLDQFYQMGGTQDGFYILSGLTGDSGASPQHISARWENEGYDLQSYGSDDHKFAQTYFDLIDQQLITQVAGEIQLNSPVTDINYQSDQILIRIQGGQTITAGKVLLTVPLTVLKQGDINFTPSLPASKTESLSHLGMEPGMKLFLRFSNKFTDKNIIGGSTCAAYVCESYKRNSQDLVLFGFAMGDQAKLLSDMGETAALQALLDELDLMFNGAASASYKGHFFKDWYKEPYIRGAYSYPLVGMKEDTRKNLAQPVDNKLFFAGEATNCNGHHQTVHGAVETGYREVINILNSVS
ncbi:MAG: FAD-dependent oxidoreductase [Bacteroidia bacterium]|nr:FAD-dependent oxidoreductase [Bacteroidia bacterium]